MLLECKAKGAVCYDWYKNGQSYQQGLTNGVLILEPCTVKDRGEYYCVVANDDGRVQSKPARVTVGRLACCTSGLSLCMSFTLLLFMISVLWRSIMYVIQGLLAQVRSI